jgi:hypothetical protein
MGELVEFPELGRIAYLTGCSTELTRAADRPELGLLVTPASSVHRQIGHYELWAADNGCYVESKAGRPFDAERWLRWLEALPRERCLFVALPDVLEWHEIDGKRVPVGNLEATLERSARYVDHVRELGFPVALVAQDGLESLDQIPFEVDAIFVGGSDAYKLGPQVRALVAEAKAAGKWVHVGRVNGGGRFQYCAEIGADSADGTVLAFGPEKNWPRVISWLDRTENVKAA